LAYTPKQARQLIVHGHWIVNDRKGTIRVYLVKRYEEVTISYSPYSAFSNELHPSRPNPEYVEMAMRAASVAPKEGQESEDIMGRMRLAKKTATLGEEQPVHKKRQVIEKKVEDTKAVEADKKESAAEGKSEEKPESSGEKADEKKKEPDTKKNEEGQ
jgi:ribosomal protein S4